MRCVVLLRGINVGGRDKVSMADLRARLIRSFSDVRTYLQSGNLALDTDSGPDEVAVRVADELARTFGLADARRRVLVLDTDAYRRVIRAAPPGFGTEPDTYRYDVGFFLGVSAAEVKPHLDVHPDVDDVSVGEAAFYHRRLTALARRSRVARGLLGTPVNASLTIRNWRTVSALATL
ncbi:DUF1697 domain-containing protein [Microlunatus sp. GCM10028923]|uniref:DUF1697 domain-containing protein n=1 Tax=Microlunatus sp. GCM10028923 TaxID=3273400 RepID=UPI00360B59A3